MDPIALEAQEVAVCPAPRTASPYDGGGDDAEGDRLAKRQRLREHKRRQQGRRRKEESHRGLQVLSNLVASLFPDTTDGCGLSAPVSIRDVAIDDDDEDGPLDALALSIVGRIERLSNSAYSALSEDSGGVTINWGEIPPPVDISVEKDGKGGCRSQRKRWQADSFAALLAPLVKDGDVIVDFGSGSGNFSLPLAFAFPKCRFILVDLRQQALDIAADKARRAGLQNVSTRTCLIQDYNDPFDVCISLHACGNASDYAQVQAINRGAAYILCPCCVGKLQHSVDHLEGKEVPEFTKVGAKQLEEGKTTEMDNHRGGAVCVELTHPRSIWLAKHINHDSFRQLAAAADWSDYDFGTKETEWRRMCKMVIELDRNAAAKEIGYSTWLTKLKPLDASPKNDILIGVPHDRHFGLFAANLSVAQ